MVSLITGSSNRHLQICELNSIGASELKNPFRAIICSEFSATHFGESASPLLGFLVELSVYRGPIGCVVEGEVSHNRPRGWSCSRCCHGNGSVGGVVGRAGDSRWKNTEPLRTTWSCHVITDHTAVSDAVLYTCTWQCQQWFPPPYWRYTGILQ